MKMTVEDYAQGIWSSGSNDDVWDAIFRWPRDAYDLELEYGDPEGYPPDETPGLADVAGELLEKIMRSPDFTVGDLTHEQVIAAIIRRWPILGPNPVFKGEDPTDPGDSPETVGYGEPTCSACQSGGMACHNHREGA
jgi:hypothetical protein